MSALSTEICVLAMSTVAARILWLCSAASEVILTIGLGREDDVVKREVEVSVIGVDWCRCCSVWMRAVAGGWFEFCGSWNGESVAFAAGKKVGLRGLLWTESRFDMRDTLKIRNK